MTNNRKFKTACMTSSRQCYFMLHAVKNDTHSYYLVLDSYARFKDDFLFILGFQIKAFWLSFIASFSLSPLSAIFRYFPYSSKNAESSCSTRWQMNYYMFCNFCTPNPCDRTPPCWRFHRKFQMGIRLNIFEMEQVIKSGSQIK